MHSPSLSRKRKSNHTDNDRRHKRKKDDEPYAFEPIRVPEEDQDQSIVDILGLPTYTLVNTQYRRHVTQVCIEQTNLCLDTMTIILKYLEGEIRVAYRMYNFDNNMHPYISLSRPDKIREYILQHNTKETLRRYTVGVQRIPIDFVHLLKPSNCGIYHVDPVKIANTYRTASDSYVQEWHRIIQSIYYCMEHTDKHNWCKRRLHQIEKEEAKSARQNTTTRC
jgi:hypothetical protein